MRLDLFPLETETDDLLLTRLMEECGEVIQAASKCLRFGIGSHACAGRPDMHGARALLAEIADVRLVAAEVERRLAAPADALIPVLLMRDNGTLWCSECGETVRHRHLQDHSPDCVIAASPSADAAGPGPQGEGH